MAVASTSPALDRDIDGTRRRLLLRNQEIERFERQYSPLGIFEFLDRLMGRGLQPEARHVRDLLALALIGGGMNDTDADRLIANLDPSHNIALRELAREVLGVTFFPAIAAVAPPPDKKKAGSRPKRSSPSITGTESKK